MCAAIVGLSSCASLRDAMRAVYNSGSWKLRHISLTDSGQHGQPQRTPVTPPCTPHCTVTQRSWTIKIPALKSQIREAIRARDTAVRATLAIRRAAPQIHPMERSDSFIVFIGSQSSQTSERTSCRNCERFCVNRSLVFTSRLADLPRGISAISLSKASASFCWRAGWAAIDCSACSFHAV